MKGYCVLLKFFPFPSLIHLHGHRLHFTTHLNTTQTFFKRKQLASFHYQFPCPLLHFADSLNSSSCSQNPGSKNLAGFLRIFFVNEKSALGNEMVSAEARAKASGSINNFPAGFAMKTRHGEGHDQDCLATRLYFQHLFFYP